MIVVTGATGKLGRLATDSLLARGVAPAELAVAVRSPDKAADLAAKGVAVRRADYNEPDTLAEAFADADKLLFISSSEVGQRIAQHANVVAAATAAGVGLVAYTSILRADTNGTGLAAEHREAEKLIRESGLPFVLLRNGWYLENYTEHLAPALDSGVYLGSGASGRVNAAARADYAEAAAAVLTSPGHAGAVYELAGDDSFDYAELAAEIGKAAGRDIEYRDLSTQEHVATLEAAGVPEFMAAMMADWDASVARGELACDSRRLHRLIGRDTTPLSAAVAAAV